MRSSSAETNKLQRRWSAVIAVLLLSLASGCATTGAYSPKLTEQPPLHLERVQTREENGVSVEVSIPTDEAASAFFGVPLAKHNVQPIWVRIVNASDTDYWLMPFAIDASYYSPDEAAFVTGKHLNDEEKAQNKALFRRHGMDFFIKAGTTSQGYVYAPFTRGGRLIDINLTSHLKRVDMRFTMLLPTESFDYEKSALREMYSKVDQFPDLTLDEFREALRKLPCCAANADGEVGGDPLNLAIVGSGEKVISALVGSGWDFTESITIDSIRRMIGAAIAENEFLTAPISSLHLFGRKQDIALQRARATISQRNHMRLWLAPFRCEGEPVWVGQISRDIGVKFTTKSPSFTTHVIDPIVDEAREYLLHSLLFAHTVRQFGFIDGVGASSKEHPRHNLTDDPYITDGMRMVLWIAEQPVPSHLTTNVGWNASTDPAREGRGEDFVVPVLPAPVLSPETP